MLDELTRSLQPAWERRASSPRWAFVRLGLSVLQIAGATASLVLLLRTGPSSTTIAVVALTTSVSGLSFLLFGRKRR